MVVMKMRPFGFCIVFFVVVVFAVLSKSSNSVSGRDKSIESGFISYLCVPPGLPPTYISKQVFYSAVISHEVEAVVDYGRTAAVVTNRKLKETINDINNTVNNRNLGSINQEDYPRFDPSPSSKAAIHAGPIEHGTPLMPFVPQPTPPAHPRHASPP